MKHLLPIIIGVLALVGLMDSTYLALIHFGAVDPSLVEAAGICPISGGKCEGVVTSRHATVLGIPHAVLGMAYFAFVLGAVVVRIKTGRWLAPWATLVVMLGGMLFSAFLVHRLLYQLYTPCPWCLAAHTANFLLVGLYILSLCSVERPEYTRSR